MVKDTVLKEIQKKVFKLLSEGKDRKEIEDATNLDFKNSNTEHFQSSVLDRLIRKYENLVNGIIKREGEEIKLKEHNVRQKENKIRVERVILSKIREVHKKTLSFARFTIIFHVYFLLFKYNLSKPKDSFLKWIGTISFSLIFLFSFSTTIIKTLGNLKDESLLVQLLSNFSLALLGVFASLLAAVFIEILIRLKEEYQLRTHAFKLKQLLNCDLNDKSVAIVVPKYPIARNKPDSLGYTEDIYRITHDDKYVDAELQNQKSNPNYEESVHYFSTVAYQDVVAAANVVAMFEKGGLPRPQIKTDAEILNKLINKSNHNIKEPYDGTFKTFICIGLFSNEISMWINKILNNKNCKGKFFKFDKPLNKDYSNGSLGLIQLASYEGNSHVELDEKKWLNESGYLFTGNNADMNYTSYALFAKVFVGDLTFIIFGGLTARATKEVGRYLRMNWEKLCDSVDETTECVLDDNPFAFTFRLDDLGVSDKKADIHIRIDNARDLQND